MSEVPLTREAPMRGVRDILAAQLDRIIVAFGRRRRSDDAVHEIRRDVKKARATLRLLREPLGTAAYRRENRILRNAGRPLTPPRDATVLLETFDRLFGDTRRLQGEPAAKELRRALLRERSAANKQWVSQETAASADALHGVRQRVQRLSEARLDRAELKAGLKRAYRKTRKAYAHALSQLNDECLHEWRKQVKYLIYQLEIVRPLEPKGIVKFIKKARKLADHLGEDHDLALLHGKIGQHLKASAAYQRVAKALAAKVQRKRVRLQRKSYRLGRKLYSDPPRRFARTLAG